MNVYDVYYIFLVRNDKMLNVRIIILRDNNCKIVVVVFFKKHLVSGGLGEGWVLRSTNKWPQWWKEVAKN